MNAAIVKYNEYTILLCDGCTYDGMQREAEYFATPLPAGSHRYIVMDAINGRVAAYVVDVEREPGFSFVGGYEIAVPQIFLDTFIAERDLILLPRKTEVTVPSTPTLGATAGEAMVNDVAVRNFARAAGTPGLVTELWMALRGVSEEVTVTIVFSDQSKIIAKVISGLDGGASVKIISVKDAQGRELGPAGYGGGSSGGGGGLNGIEIRPMGTVHSSGWYFCGPDGRGGTECYPIPAPKTTVN